MKGRQAYIKAYFRDMSNGGALYNGEQWVIKHYLGLTDEDVNQQITRDVGKYGYIKVEPLTKEQIDKILEETNESNTQI